MLLITGCTDRPRGGILPEDSKVVTVARQWVRSVQTGDQFSFASTLSPSRLSDTSVNDPALAAGLANCPAEFVETLGVVTDGSFGHERYMVVVRYAGKCLRSPALPETDTLVVYELNVDGAPKVDTWAFGAPPGL